MGDPVYWVTCVILAHCVTHVLLGWPDGSLVWILATIFEKAVSYRLPMRQSPADPYPPFDPRRRGIPVGFHTFCRDVRMLARQYFIPGPADFARLRRIPPRQTIRLSWKWNATVGIPLGETSPPRVAGDPRRIMDWPDFHRLLTTLDQGCTMGSWGFMHCTKCRKATRVSYFRTYELQMESVLRSGTAEDRSWTCADWGTSCSALARQIFPNLSAPPVRAAVSSSTSSLEGASVAVSVSSCDSPPTVSELLPARTAPEPATIVRVEENTPESEAAARLREIEDKYRAAQRQIEYLEKQQASRLPASTAAPGVLLPQTTPELSSLDNRAAIKAWLNNVQRFCERWAIPEALRVEWASMGLKGSAANAWATMTFRRDVAAISFGEMEELLMKKFFQQHSLYTLWGQWTSLRQGPHETGQAYCDRVKNLLDQEDLPE